MLHARQHARDSRWLNKLGKVRLNSATHKWKFCRPRGEVFRLKLAPPDNVSRAALAKHQLLDQSQQRWLQGVRKREDVGLARRPQPSYIAVIELEKERCLAVRGQILVRLGSISQLTWSGQKSELWTLKSFNNFKSFAAKINSITATFYQIRQFNRPDQA